MPESDAILLVEDDPKDVELIREMFAEYHLQNELIVYSSGRDALDYLFRRGPFADDDSPRPLLVLLDLQMAGVSGIEVLREVKEHSDLYTLPIVIVTNSRSDRDLKECRYLEADAVLSKPLRFHSLVDTFRDLGLNWRVGPEPA